MKNILKFQKMAFFAPAIAIILVGTSCKKDTTVTPTTPVISNVTTDVSTLSDLATTSCQITDTISMANLPSVTTNYLTTNYANYNVEIVYAPKTSGNLNGYLAVLYNSTGTPQRVDVRFDATGTFVKALTVPAHMGFGVYQTDTIGLSKTPQALQNYFSSTGGGLAYTVQKAFQEADSSYTILATLNGVTSAFRYIPSVSTTSLTQISLGTIDLTTTNIDVSTLPAPIVTYLNQTYPNGTIERVLAQNCSGTLNGYIVVFKATDGSQDLGMFDSTGNTVEVLQTK